MLVQTAHIQGISRDHYDALMASGWFRGTGIVYRSEIVCIDEQVFAVQNIRFPLADYSAGKKHRKILRTNNSRFTYSIGEPSVDERKEELYRKHTKRFKAFVHQSLAEIVYFTKQGCEFDTKELCVYDGDKLIAVSYFDIGKQSMASILCIYDQSYYKSSLGIYTMLLELEYAQSQGVKYYYPGYVLDRPSSFDYKLALGKSEWMGGDKRWYKQEELPPYQTKGDLIREKMAELHVKLVMSGYVPQLTIYPYFTVGQIMQDRRDLIRVPCYYTFYHNEDLLAASYDVNTNSFVVFDVLEEEELEFTQHLNLSDDYLRSDIYELRIVRSSFHSTLEKERWVEEYQDAEGVSESD
jgi:arginyl-tRNA--protein-N-Asp/Glu arginylyltransferase